jgi:hypothetical protein
MTKTAMILQLLCQLRINGKLPEILFADKNKDWRSAVLDTVMEKPVMTQCCKLCTQMLAKQ